MVLIVWTEPIPELRSADKDYFQNVNKEVQLQMKATRLENKNRITDERTFIWKKACPMEANKIQNVKMQIWLSQIKLETEKMR